MHCETKKIKGTGGLEIVISKTTVTQYVSCILVMQLFSLLFHPLINASIHSSTHSYICYFALVADTQLYRKLYLSIGMSACRYRLKIKKAYIHPDQLGRN